MEQLFEVLMLVCFGISWPFNISKSWKSRTARGKSILFEVCVAVGYCCGIAGKFIAGNVTYVLVVYVLDLLMVSIDLILTLRNKALDAMADRKAEKAAAKEQEEQV